MKPRKVSPKKNGRNYFKRYKSRLITEMIENDTFHNTIFYGPPGTGKTSTIL